MTQPRITVGLIVRNGERHIAAAIESFLAQSLRDFVLVVHDNASTDRTISIVEQLASRDPRVRLVRNPTNVGAMGNCIAAAKLAQTPLFCWAAADDLREAMFLEQLTKLLDAHPEAGLACCAVRNIDPDGTPRDIRSETATLKTSTGMTSAQRVRMFLQHMPGTPFYGLFRTECLKPALETLRRLDALADNGPPLLGVDMILLAHHLAHAGITYSPQPLLLFRRGGISHILGRYGSLGAYLRQLRLFNRELREMCSTAAPRATDRLSLSIARRASVARWLLSRDMRAMSAHYLANAVPGLRGVRSRMRARIDPTMRRLRRRLHALPDNARIVLFGAGKHTRRRLDDLSAAVRGRASIVALCDDHAADRSPIQGLPIMLPRQLRGVRPDVLLVSSDTYEAAMHRRARAIAGPEVAVWCLYDVALEANARESTDSPASTDATNADTSSSVSPAMVSAR